MATTTLSTIPALTEAVGVPRLAGVGFPVGLPFGPPKDRGGQADVLLAFLRTLESIREPGGRIDLPFEWSHASRAFPTHPKRPPPIVGLLKQKPWLLPRFLSRDPPPGHRSAEW